jgi:hypothetical protein
MNMKNQHMNRIRIRRLLAALLVTSAVLAACGGASAAAPTPTSATVLQSGSSPASVVLPVTDDPISNTSTIEALKIDSVLVENNVDAAGKDTNDHLEIALTNTGSTELSGFEVYYTFTDPTDDVTESYYVALPETFTIAPGGSRIAHFDNSGAADHFAVNEFSLYATSLNALDVTVEVSASGAAPQTATVQKDAGGEESSD